MHPNANVSGEPFSFGAIVTSQHLRFNPIRVVEDHLALFCVPSGLPVRLTLGMCVHRAPAAPWPSQRGRTRSTRSLSTPTGRFCTQPPGTRSESGTCGGQFHTASSVGIMVEVRTKGAMPLGSNPPSFTLESSRFNVTKPRDDFEDK